MEFNPSLPERSSTEDDDDAKKKKKVTGAAAFLSQKETAKPENDKQTQEITQAVEKLIWRREEEPKEDSKTERQEEINLTDEEAKSVAIDHVAERQDEVGTELQQVEPGTREAAEAVADAVLLDHDEGQLRSTATFEEALRNALREAQQTLAAERLQAETPTAEAPPVSPPTVEETAPEQSSYAYVPPAAPPRVSMMAPPPQYERGTMLPPLESAPSAPEPEAMPAPKRGLFGFLRRRSLRDRAERRFAARQEALVQEVAGVHSRITEQESYIRGVAGRSFEAQHETTPITPPEALRPTMQEASPEQPTMPIPEKPATAERLVNEPEYKTAQMLTHEELLKVSEKIIIEGASLRSIYESKRITEKGLRRLVNEYYRGGNMRRLLAKEMVEKEREFEIDPQLREHFSGGGIDGGGAHPAQAALPVTPSDETSPQPGQAPNKKSSLRTPSLPDVVTSPQNLVMTAWVVLIVILAIVAAILLLSR